MGLSGEMAPGFGAEMAKSYPELKLIDIKEMSQMSYHRNNFEELGKNVDPNFEAPESK
jgi:hypothetical protein